MKKEVSFCKKTALRRKGHSDRNRGTEENIFFKVSVKGVQTLSEGEERLVSDFVYTKTSECNAVMNKRAKEVSEEITEYNKNIRNLKKLYYNNARLLRTQAVPEDEFKNPIKREELLRIISRLNTDQHNIRLDIAKLVNASDALVENYSEEYDEAVAFLAAELAVYWEAVKKRDAKIKKKLKKKQDRQTKRAEKFARKRAKREDPQELPQSQDKAEPEAVIFGLAPLPAELIHIGQLKQPEFNIERADELNLAKAKVVKLKVRKPIEGGTRNAE